MRGATSRTFRIRVCALLLVISGALIAAGSAGAARPELLHRLAKTTTASGLTVAPDGTIWIDGHRGTRSSPGNLEFIGSLDTSGSLTRFTLPERRVASTPVVFPDGEVWAVLSYFSGPQTEVLEVTGYSSSGPTHTYVVSPGVSRITATTQAGGELWFAGSIEIEGGLRSAIGSISVGGGGSIGHLHTLPANCSAGSIVGSGESVWFAQTCRSSSAHATTGSALASLRRIEPDGAISSFPLARGDAPASAAAGQDGTVWFGIARNEADPKAARVASISPTGKFNEFSAPDAYVYYPIAVGPGGRLWFTSNTGGSRANALGSIDRRGHTARPICLNRKCNLGAPGLATGPEGDLWFSAVLARRPIGGGGGLGESPKSIGETGYIGRLG